LSRQQRCNCHTDKIWQPPIQCIGGCASAGGGASQSNQVKSFDTDRERRRHYVEASEITSSLFEQTSVLVSARAVPHRVLIVDDDASILADISAAPASPDLDVARKNWQATLPMKVWDGLKARPLSGKFSIRSPLRRFRWARQFDRSYLRSLASLA
jgi:hypothetical protein